MKQIHDIEDDEIRIIIGSAKGDEKRPLYMRWWFWLSIVALVALLTFFGVYSLTSKSKTAITDSVSMQYESSSADVCMTKPEPVEPTTILNQPSDVLVCDTVVNDVPLTVFTPVNVEPELVLGYPSPTDDALMLAFQAADVRADNGKIVGAFVLKGEPLAWGLSKKGYCAIIDGNIQLGVAENSPLFEEATEKDGYFFRQYPLVNNGVMVDNKPKNKSIRRALCERDGQIIVVTSLSRESFHDFAQALVDLGVRNAIYLVGGDAYGFYKRANGELSCWDNVNAHQKSQFVNFIVWKKMEEQEQIVANK